LNPVRRLSNAAKLNVAGLVLTAAGMLLQIAAGSELSHESDGSTILRGPVVDQAALHGLLQKVRDVGLPLVSVTYVEPDNPDVPTNKP
jgi:hypothetical protein